MPTVKRFEDLECWQEARKLVGCIYALANKDSFKKDYELTGQIKRSAVSIMANIAEGFHRNSSKEFMRFLDYSRASIAETLSHLYIALDQLYISETEMQNAKQQSEIVWKKVNNFISYLNQRKK
jgi:four helix bundle protein